MPEFPPHPGASQAHIARAGIFGTPAQSSLGQSLGHSRSIETRAVTQCTRPRVSCFLQFSGWCPPRFLGRRPSRFSGRRPSRFSGRRPSARGVARSRPAVLGLLALRLVASRAHNQQFLGCSPFVDSRSAQSHIAFCALSRLARLCAMRNLGVSRPSLRHVVPCTTRNLASQTL